jgi:phage I-like protein
MTVGSYYHPVYGDIDFTTERLQRFADSINNRVREIDADIDYDHKKRTDEAAGWVKQASVKEDGLHLLVEWTGEAAGKIRSKAYKYFSPEFVDEWEHPKTKVVHKDVLNGGAITNRPFLKDLQPLNLSEMLDRAPVDDPEERNDMDLKKFTELLGLAEGTSEDDVLAKTKELMEKAAKADAPSAEAELIKLSETNPAIKMLMDQQTELRRQNAATQATLRLTEVRAGVLELSESLRSKNIALPAAVIEDLTRVLHESTDAHGTKVMAIVKTLGESGFVELGEIGRQRTGGEQKDPVKVFGELVSKEQTDHKLSYADAVQKVASENPDAYRNYAGASYANKVGE